MLSQYLLLLDDENDKWLFETMYHQNDRKVHAIAWSILHNRDDAEDAVQTTWERVINHFPDARKRYYNSASGFEAWLIVVAQNIAKDEIRRRKRAPEPLEDWDAPTPSNVEEKSESEILHDLIDTMPASTKDVLEKRIIYGDDFKAMGKALKCSKDAARMRFNRAMEELKRQMVKAGYEG